MSKRVKEKKAPTMKGSVLWGIWLFLALLLIDMVTKIAAQEYFTRPDAPEKIDIIPGWVSLTLTFNRGIAYGVGNDAPSWLKILIISATAVVMLVLAVVYCRLDKSHGWARLALVFIVAGGVGNLIDRVYFQVWDPSTAAAERLVADGVRDMVDLNSIGFAVCNFADFFVTGGAVLLVLSLLFCDKDALFPIGKYKRMAKEIAALAEEKEKGEKQVAAEEIPVAERENGKPEVTSPEENDG